MWPCRAPWPRPLRLRLLQTGSGGQKHRERRGEARENVHKEALEEVFQLPLGCRVGKVADVQAATFGGTGKNGIVGSRLVGEGGIGQSVGNVVDRVSNFLSGSRHFGWGWRVSGLLSDGCREDWVVAGPRLTFSAGSKLELWNNSGELSG